MCDCNRGRGLQVEDICKLRLRNGYDTQTGGMISMGGYAGRRRGSPRSQEGLHGDKKFPDKLPPCEGRSELCRESSTGGVMRNFGVKMDQPILLLCSWQSGILLCGIRASTLDILDPYPRNISDQNTHYKPKPSKASPSAVNDYR